MPAAREAVIVSCGIDDVANQQARMNLLGLVVPGSESFKGGTRVRLE
jgi:hypothetical protein